MLVYGDLTRTVAPSDLLAEAEADLIAGDTVSALIGLGQLLQGLADAEFEQRGCDARSPATDAIAATLTTLSSSPSGEGDHAKHGGGGRTPGGVDVSPLSHAGEAGLTAPPRGSSLLAELRSILSDHPELHVRVPEGYAFYALHPALYAAAAAELPQGDWRVIGIRSIGTSLAAVVADVLGAPPPVTVRPTGHPFARELRLALELEAEWAAHLGPFAVVDEGPGLSGSSFGAVADALERVGVRRERIAFLPGHGGDLGPQASPAHRARWAAALRPTATLEEVVLPRLQAGVEALVGPSAAPLRDLSGGAWRELVPGDSPVNPGQERRKFLHTADGVWLLKFAGLGRIGRAKLPRARALHAAGWTAEPAGLVEGFLVERWVQPARAARPSVEQLADYLAFRARTFPADPGASLSELHEMISVNAAEALGPAAAEAAARLPHPARLQPRVRPVHVDARLHAWEWLAGPGDRLLKADALDHSEAHDLVGPQDIAWDVAGAEAEFDLSPGQTEALRARVGADAELLAFMRPAYLAFQLGLWTMAAEAQDGVEAAGARTQAAGYARRLAELLDVDPPPPPV